MRYILSSKVPVEVELPGDMVWWLLKVLAGEYDAPFFGRELTILDIGANVGTFTLWANQRWPLSTIHAYEPNPGTFEMLQRNVGWMPNVKCSQAAVYPSQEPTAAFFSRYDGEGQAGLVMALQTTWKEMPESNVQQVPVVHPRDLPEADIVKIDAEGSEGAIVANMNLDNISLLLVEYQNLEVRRQIWQATSATFKIEREESESWRKAFRYSSAYRDELKNDRFGTMILVNANCNRLRRDDSIQDSGVPVRQALRQLGVSARRAFSDRLADARRRFAYLRRSAE